MRGGVSRASGWRRIGSSREISGQNQFFLQIDASLAEQAGHGVFGEAGGIEEHAHGAFGLGELNALDTVDLAHAVDRPQLFLSWRSLVAVRDFEISHIV